MSSARPWLPPGVRFERVDRRIASIVREWANSWFDASGDIATAPATSPRAQSSHAAKRYSCTPGAWLAVPEGAIAAMGRCALRIESDASETQADRALFDAVGDECLAALRESLVHELQLGNMHEGDTASEALAPASIVWTIDCARCAARLQFVMTEAARLELLLRLLPPAPPKPELVSPAIALAPHEVDLAASLGTCGVTVAELRSLAPGDVLVLGRDLSAPLPFVVDRVATRGGSGTVTRRADSLVLEIAEPITGRNT